MPYKIVHTPVSSVRADAIAVPTDVVLSTAYKYGLDQRRVERFRSMCPHLEQGSVAVMHQMDSTIKHVVFVIQENKPETSAELASCYQAVFERAAANKWESIALPLFTLSQRTTFPTKTIYDVAIKEIKRALSENDLNIVLSMTEAQNIPVRRGLFDRISDYLKVFVDTPKQHGWADQHIREYRPATMADRDESILFDSVNKLLRPSPFEELSDDEDDFFEFALPDQAELPLPPPASSAEKTAESSHAFFVPSPKPSPAKTPKVVDPYADPRSDEDMEAIYGDRYSKRPRAHRQLKEEWRAYEAPRASYDPTRNRVETEESFSEAVLRIIREKSLSDPECYNRANVSRAVFNKIKQSALYPDSRSYKPSKATALALALALELSLDETNDLLKKAGLALSHSDKGDVIVEYFLVHRIYDIFELNEVLFRFDQPLLGSF